MYPAGASERLRMLYDRAVALGSAYGLEVPTAYFRFGITRCWKCDNQILVFSWPGKQPMDESQPRDPKPRTIKLTRSQTTRTSYWASTCPCCTMLQGDFFIYMEPDGPFFGGDMGDDSAGGFLADMERIAEKAERDRPWVEGPPKSRPAAEPVAGRIPGRRELLEPLRPIDQDRLNPSGTCVFCGTITKDWWSYDGATKACKCRPCKERGKA